MDKSKNFCARTDPFSDCKVGMDSVTKKIHDKINGFDFEIGEHWNITFNDSLMMTECLDTIASDVLDKLRSFNAHTVNVEDHSKYFESEITLMISDSIKVLQLGRMTIDDRPALYVVAQSSL